MVSSSRTLVVIAVIVLGSITLLFQFSGTFPSVPCTTVGGRDNVPKVAANPKPQTPSYDQLASRLPCPLKQQPWSWYSQCYQDSILWEEIFSKYPRKCYGTFLDVGSFDGKSLSNSKFFEETLGWHGICIEGGIKNFNQLIQNRPECINLYCAAYDKSGEVLHFIDEGTAGHIGGDTEVISCSLTDVLLRHNMLHIDYMSIDIEDAEIFAFQGIDFSIIDIDVITVELAGRNPDGDEAVRNVLRANNYTFLHRITWPNDDSLLDELWAKL